MAFWRVHAPEGTAACKGPYRHSEYECYKRGLAFVQTEVGDGLAHGYPLLKIKQGKSEGFDSCDRPSNLTQIEFKSLIFQPM